VWKKRPSISLLVISTIAVFWSSFDILYGIYIQNSSRQGNLRENLFSNGHTSFTYVNAFLHVLLTFLGRSGRH
jgi:hypothetical protein